MDGQEHKHVTMNAMDGTDAIGPILSAGGDEQAAPEADRLSIDTYPDMPSLNDEDGFNEEIEREILQGVKERIAVADASARAAMLGAAVGGSAGGRGTGAASGPTPTTSSAVPVPSVPDGYVANAEDTPATSEEFTLWSPAEQHKIGVGTIVRHEATEPGGALVKTHAIVVSSTGRTLGLDSLAIHAYEHDGIPPGQGIQPAPSRRRPIVACKAEVLSTTADGVRPVLSGPVTAVTGNQVLSAHLPLQGKLRDVQWLNKDGMLLGFYDDGMGGFGVFAEERARVLGPKQGHIIFSGTPGAGKTSQYLTLLIALYSHLQSLNVAAGNAPGVASVAFNVKAADLLFLDHQNPGQLGTDDIAMWSLANVNPGQPAFGRVHVLVPLAPDGLNRHSLRNNPAADTVGYSTTTTFALGISDLWPYLDLLFDDRGSSATNLLAEIQLHFEGRSRRRAATYSLADVLNLFATTLLPKNARAQSDFADFHPNTVRAVHQRLHSLPSTLRGLIDHTGTGFGLDVLDDLRPFDLVVVDLERLLANPSDPELADAMLKIVTKLILHKLTESVTRRQSKVDNVIVFADELNTLAPAQGNAGVGEYLAHLARTTRDRGVVLFGAGQFRSGINRDILKAASVHFSMQTPEYELQDALYANLTPEVKARLTGLLPGQTLLQFPSMRKPVFARFPRPFVLTGADGLHLFPPLPPRPLGDCIAERLKGVDPSRPPQVGDVTNLIDGILAAADDEDAREEAEQTLQELLRDVEMEYGRTGGTASGQTPWERYRRLVQDHLLAVGGAAAVDTPPAAMPAAAFDDEEDEE